MRRSGFKQAELMIPAIDLVIVDLYPFEGNVASGASEADVICRNRHWENLLIRAACEEFFKMSSFIASKI